MFNNPFFAAGYFPAPYFPKSVLTGGADYYPTPFFGARNSPGDFWVIGSGGPAPTPTPTPDGGGGGWDVVKTNTARRREAARLAKIAEEDELILDVVKLFMQGIQ